MPAAAPPPPLNHSEEQGASGEHGKRISRPLLAAVAARGHVLTRARRHDNTMFGQVHAGSRARLGTSVHVKPPLKALEFPASASLPSPLLPPFSLPFLLLHLPLLHSLHPSCRLFLLLLALVSHGESFFEGGEEEAWRGETHCRSFKAADAGVAPLCREGSGSPSDG